MARAAKACSDPHCPNAQPCPTHRKVPWAGSTRRSRLPKDWERRRRRILRRDPTCQDGTVCKGLAMSTEVDHIQPGDNHADGNLRGTCSDCHKAKTQKEAAAARHPRGHPRP